MNTTEPAGRKVIIILGLLMTISPFAIDMYLPAFGQSGLGNGDGKLAAARDDRRHLAIEIAVEQLDQVLRRQPLRKRREAAHVGQPDHGVDRLEVAAPDPSGQDLLAGMAADVWLK